MAAIDHGADAVYIGAQRFGARVSAGNSVEDITLLCQYAHRFEAKVYVTVNTIFYDNELEDVRVLLAQLQEAGVDAILVQDMALLSLSDFKSSIPLHASTQTDNRTADKVAWLASLGFRRVVLARELSVEEIREIHHQVPDVELEVFVHGALCVSYSGLCYASQYCFGRSANRGECAQFCRMKFDLVDADGTVIEHQRHLLSLKDMNQLANLEQLADAGASSFKIEGRLKDIGYVKNVTAAYSQALDQLVAARPDSYRRASRGHSTCSFTPDLNRTFNRGYTSYFAPGRQPDIASFDTPKAIGQYVGRVGRIRDGKSFTIESTVALANGDGLCFLNDAGELQGFRVNRVEMISSGRRGAAETRLYPLALPASLHSGMSLYRSQDQNFEQLLAKSAPKRKVDITLSLRATENGFSLAIDGEMMATIEQPHQTAQSPQHENMIRQLTKLGDTPYHCSHVDIPSDFDFFIPSSRLAELRRAAVSAYEKVSRARIYNKRCGEEGQPSASSVDVPAYARDYFYNVSNKLSLGFYESQGKHLSEQAFELSVPREPLIMQCRHCLRYSLGYCVKHGGKKPQWHDPLSLRLADGRCFRLQFDCNHCQMNVYVTDRR
jgi:putative protease